ncbi:hypothetical protein FACS189487_06320 [Campylobacterota bacterium]|nr:hypothetical protein FACS189487_06320 [Campylobacterota bacterium]
MVRAEILRKLRMTFTVIADLTRNLAHCNALFNEIAACLRKLSCRNDGDRTRNGMGRGGLRFFASL